MKKVLGSAMALAMASIANAQNDYYTIDDVRKYVPNSLGGDIGGKRSKYRRKAEPRDLHHKRYVRRKMVKQSRKNNRKNK
jgi:hypothetical protein